MPPYTKAEFEALLSAELGSLKPHQIMRLVDTLGRYSNWLAAGSPTDGYAAQKTLAEISVEWAN